MTERRRALHRLAEHVGILPEYLDLTGVVRRAPDETRIAILGAMGFPASTEAEARASLAALRATDRERVLEPVRVRTRAAAFGVRARVNRPVGEAVRWRAKLSPEEGEPRLLDGVAEVGRGGVVRLDLGKAPPPGYHSLRVAVTAGGQEREARQSLIVVPRTCRRVPRVFGVVANLYAARGAGDWGIGDLSTLATLLEWTASVGGAFVGVNPLHAIRNRGWEVSPYSPVSRLFRNPIYIDPAAVPASDEVRAILDAPDVADERESLRGSARVEYERVMALKRRVLEALHAGAETGAAYRRFLDAEGEPLRRFATFEALTDHFGQGDWRAWPAPYRDPRSPEVAAFRDEHARLVDFHQWLQFELDRQLGSAAERGRRAGLSVGLYQDLAIGTSATGADIWANPHLFLEGIGIGAPPDDYAAGGQNWGLPPIDPHALREDGYRFWIELLRASFAHAGALRIDHVLGLFRQFWIPEGASAAEGAYIRFPADDLLGILLLEARRHHAVVVGEDLGTVPPEVRPALRRRRILASRVFYFERDGDRFRPAAEYEPLSLATADTHDLPPVAGYWAGRDIELRREAGDFPSDEAAEWERQRREVTRRLMLERLAADGALPSPEQPASTAELVGAMHAFLCASPAAMVGFNLDDLVGETDPVNLPGVTPDRYPSWTRRLARPVESLSVDPSVQTALRCGRRRGG
ncbi:MAG TPA: 4-alpha-glucanotransferase [Gemmatimonadales bacterium]